MPSTAVRRASMSSATPRIPRRTDSISCWTRLTAATSWRTTDISSRRTAVSVSIRLVNVPVIESSRPLVCPCSNSSDTMIAKAENATVTTRGSILLA